MSSFASLAPELRSLCRRLTLTQADQLPHLLPILLKDLQRCGVPLSAPQESKTNTTSSETAVLVHKLKTQITALLNGRSIEGRFAAVSLVKGYVEAGGWESLRVCEPWVRGLISILQKKDPIVSKELCLVTLTKIYTLAQKYPTLIREFVTPTLPSFITTCLQILKPTGSGKGAKIPWSITETAFEAFSTLIPLFPTTLRPFTAQFRSVAKPYLAPTSFDLLCVPETLQNSSRHLVVLLHMTAAKNGGSDEWAKHLSGLITEFHETADQVLRAVQETWESTSGYMHRAVDFDAEPRGGSSSPDQLPPWAGIQAGSERMVGLLRSVTDCLLYATKVPVTIPISTITDVITRIAAIMPPTSGKAKSESVQLNTAVGREERDDLWAVFPDIQIATIQMILALVKRLEKNYVPMSQDTIDQTLRMYQSCYRLPEARSLTFTLFAKLLQLCGPTMTKRNVEALALLVKSCCRDLLGSAGQIQAPKPQQSSSMANGSKSRSAIQNADAFLSSSVEEDVLVSRLEAGHRAAAETLLVTLFNRLPQQHINPALRSNMLKTAILCNIKDAQIASVLHPSRNRNGKTPQVILPYLHRQFPHDESVELLRFSFRPAAAASRSDNHLDLDGEDMDLDEDATEERRANADGGLTFDRPFEAITSTDPLSGGWSAAAVIPEQPVAKTAPPAPSMIAEAQPSPFLPTTGMGTSPDIPAVQPLAASSSGSGSSNPLKRKSVVVDGPDLMAPASSKRMDVDASPDIDPGFEPVGSLVESSLETARTAAGVSRDDDGDADESDDESVHLNMELDSDEDDDIAGEEDEEEEKTA